MMNRKDRDVRAIAAAIKEVVGMDDGADPGPGYRETASRLERALERQGFGIVDRDQPTISLDEVARLRGIEDIARDLATGWEAGYPVGDQSEADLIARLGPFLEARP